MKSSNVLKIKTLPKGWTDKNFVMLHACFQLLTNFIKKEKPFNCPSWKQSEEMQAAKTELIFLNNWWKKRKKLDTNFQTLNDRNAPQNLEDSQMLMRLMKVRPFLWV